MSDSEDRPIPDQGEQPSLKLWYEASQAIHHNPAVFRDALRAHRHDAILIGSLALMIVSVVVLIGLVLFDGVDTLGVVIASLAVIGVSAVVFRLRLSALKANIELRRSEQTHGRRINDPSYTHFAAMREIQSQCSEPSFYHLKIVLVALPIALLIAFLLSLLL